MKSGTKNFDAEDEVGEGGFSFAYKVTACLMVPVKLYRCCVEGNQLMLGEGCKVLIETGLAYRAEKLPVMFPQIFKLFILII
ncbi:hypothetical protein D5086_003194 [Populus alba]|uniref:Uncharacterized protein n=1 Tax=Populus alba TaxID=43335 RepID=A0ACC4D564_POPAL